MRQDEMDIVKIADVPTYIPPISVNPSPQHMPRHIQGGGASSADFVVVNHSTFPPQTRVGMAAAPIGKIYLVLEGAITLEQADGRRHVLRQGDSVFVPPNEARALENKSATSAIILVIKPPEV
jgi:quercetin dioxygenase-like cupin family protein